MFSNVQKNLQIPQGPKVQIVENFVDHDNLSNSLNENNKINEPTVKQNQNNQNKNNAGDSIKKIEENDNELDSSSKNNNMEDVKENKNKIIDNEINTKQNQNNQNKNNAGDSSKKIEENDNELNSSSKINIDTKDNGNEIKNNNEINEIITDEEQDDQNENNINEKKDIMARIETQRVFDRLKDILEVLDAIDEEATSIRRDATLDKVSGKQSQVVPEISSIENVDTTSKENANLKEIDTYKEYVRYVKDHGDEILGRINKDGNFLKIFAPLKDVYNFLNNSFENVNAIFSAKTKDNIFYIMAPNNWLEKRLEEIEKIKADLNTLFEGEGKEHLKSVFINAMYRCDSVKFNVNSCYVKICQFYKSDVAGKAVAKEIYYNLSKIFEKMPNLKSLFIPFDICFRDFKGLLKDGIVIKRKKENSNLIGCYYYNKDVVEKNEPVAGRFQAEIPQQIDEDGLILLNNRNKNRLLNIAPYGHFFLWNNFLFPDFERQSLSQVTTNEIWGDEFFHYCPEKDEQI